MHVCCGQLPFINETMCCACTLETQSKLPPGSKGSQILLLYLPHTENLNGQGPVSQTDLNLATYHIVLDLSPKTDLSFFVKSAPEFYRTFTLALFQSLYAIIPSLCEGFF